MEVKDEWYEGTKLETILCLITHEDKVQLMDFQLITVASLQILFYLVTCTDFFGVQLNREKTSDVDVINFMLGNSDFAFVGRLFVKLFYVIHRNSYGVINLLLFHC